MTYTAYFSITVKNIGVPNLNTNQFRRFMNIINIEGRILELESLNFNSPVIFKNVQLKKTTLEKLTNGKIPQDLLKEMIMLTEKDS
ncbi:hypothetical protein FF125_17365 [Aureibaculum algae]|uniref:Uncharacterized protein n=1 Tax=Aureibaculum algae TaxID=2584122 RepID=A0A5B7TV69_9FLAO|nr:hypothetical protein [Aureibaculum algae]QCX40128.1 hypothetical protein FF125_17365 [Aureibaculum algae]